MSPTTAAWLARAILWPILSASLVLGGYAILLALVGRFNRWLARSLDSLDRHDPR